jgi:hypothetical protein
VIAAFGTLGRVYWLQGNPARAGEQYEQALARARELDNTWGIAILQITLGDIALAQGDQLTASTWYRQGLEELKLQATPARMAHALRHYAGLQCASGDYRNAVRMLAAASRVQNATGLALTALPAGEEDLIAAARRTLPAHEFRVAWAEGLLLTLDDADVGANVPSAPGGVRAKPLKGCPAHGYTDGHLGGTRRHGCAAGGRGSEAGGLRWVDSVILSQTHGGV